MGTLITLLISTLTFFSCGVCAASQHQGVVAKVNGVAITEADLEYAMDTYVPPGTFHGGMGKKREQFRQPALDLLIERELLYQEAVRRGLKVSDKDVDKALGEVRKQFKDKKAFERALKESGLTLSEYRKVLRRNELIQMLLKTEVDSKATYTDKALEEYYDANKERFVRPEGFKVRHILITVPPAAGEKEKEEIRNKAAALLERVKKGEDFADLAQKYSEDPYRVKGGDLGWVHEGRLDPALEEAVKKLKPGESVLVETVHGCHIVMLEEKKSPEQKSFSEVKEALRKELEAKRRQDLKEALVKDLKEKAKIEIVEQQ